MKIFIYTIIIGIITSLSCNSSNIKQTPKNSMQNIKFIPREFHEVKLGYYETGDNPCSSRYSEKFISTSIILINIPKKIIYNSNDESIKPILPVCIREVISSKRDLKYDHLSVKIIHIKKVDEKEIYSGKIIDKEDPNSDFRLIPEPSPYSEEFLEERERERQLAINEANEYEDDELDEGRRRGDFWNVNALEYVDMPFQPGKYEVYLTCYNLESNRMIVEIIAE